MPKLYETQWGNSLWTPHCGVNIEFVFLITKNENSI